MSVNMDKLGSKVTEMTDSSDQAGAVWFKSKDSGGTDQSSILGRS